MHTLTLTTQFTFGDAVRFNSTTQNISGVGRVYGITVTAQNEIDYMIEIQDQDGYTFVQPGILESELIPDR